MRIPYSCVYHVNYLQPFGLFKFSFIQVKMVIHYEVHVILQHIEH